MTKQIIKTTGEVVTIVIFMVVIYYALTATCIAWHGVKACAG